ncbi:asparagine synthase (glutamine-hydrolyzing) [Cyanobium sp. WKJ7-Wakatipu]|uniref:asparagine synthase (glutamine-hydrolyzing) n=1 Tax=Cyanobium sp. WKJ7-Wakatipu TaxID=2823726 RepID=UPI0020CD65EA|nr:asparagine synthase (glutamine-hydrolyzing) [Cyanobium sp. WKJ7-Wakatipu]MCP9783291.1 asparagine synthase (glutamine-hydrolyzing) [Cyanobium sp. WKJ7-Wakatipu]
MCGIAGIVQSHPRSPDQLQSIAASMGAAIAYRGPDAAGVWQDPQLGFAVVHQRLAILDLTPAGDQPMHSASGRYVIAFNGEIYNHQQLRRDLDAAGLAPTWRGHADTETLLAAIEAWGLEGALQHCTGMWALALLDQHQRVLHLARDRFGEKPLYWGFSGSGTIQALLFGSELAALRAYPGFNNAIDRAALAQLLRFGQVPAPLSIYAGIAKLLAGHWVSIPLPLAPGAFLPRSQPWWQLSSVIEAGSTAAFQSDAEALDALEQSLSMAVAEQAIADVPLGAFLSGGIDSSLIAALLQRQSSQPLRTFTIGFEEAGFNEAPYARPVAEHLGTSHSETLLTSADARALIPQLPQLYSEPFADSSQLPTHLVCRAARQAGLTVALSGDGGDELFGGYNRYSWGPRIWNRLAWLPGPLRQGLGRAITALPPPAWDAIGQPLPIGQLGHKAHKLAARLRYVRSSDDLYRSLVSEWRDPAQLLQGEPPELPSTAIDQPLPACLSSDPIARMMAWDSLSYLPDDILVKVDRAAMAVGLETRAPFLDHRVAQVAWRLPMAMKIRGNTSKWALRQILYKYVPKELIERPKAGFAIPIGQWLRGPLRPWASELLHPDRLRQEGYLRPEPISQLWQQHLSGRYDHTTKLWTVLMWQAWLEQWG